MIHLGEKKNRAGESIPRVKTIFGLANKSDGHGLEHLPRVQSFGAGPKDVEFFLNDSSGAPSSLSTGQAAGIPGRKKKARVRRAAPLAMARAKMPPRAEGILACTSSSTTVFAPLLLNSVPL